MTFDLDSSEGQTEGLFLFKKEIRRTSSRNEPENKGENYGVNFLYIQVYIKKKKYIDV